MLKQRSNNVQTMKNTIPFLVFVMLLTACAAHHKVATSLSCLDAVSTESCTVVSSSDSAIDVLMETYTDDSLWCQWSITTVTDSAGHVLCLQKNINGGRSWARSSRENSKKTVLNRDSTIIHKNDSVQSHQQKEEVYEPPNKSPLSLTGLISLMCLLCLSSLICLKIKKRNEGNS